MGSKHLNNKYVVIHEEDDTPDGFRDMLIPKVLISPFWTPHISEAIRCIILIFGVDAYPIRY